MQPDARKGESRGASRVDEVARPTNSPPRAYLPDNPGTPSGTVRIHGPPEAKEVPVMASPPNRRVVGAVAALATVGVVLVAGNAVSLSDLAGFSSNPAQSTGS